MVSLHHGRRLRNTRNSGFQFPPTGYPKNLALSFDLRQDPGAWEDQERSKILWDVFPGISEIGFSDNILGFVVSVLPPKPWPLTIAGVPIYVSTGYTCPHDLPPPRLIGQAVSNRDHVKIREDFNGKDLQNWDEVFTIILGHFNDLGIEMTEVMYLENVVTIILHDNSADMGRVPCSVCQLNCFYAFESEMHRGGFSGATNQTTPFTLGNLDASVYATLRPGVVISSGKIPGTSQFSTTTTGVLVRDRNGNQFVTIADNGFPPECGREIMHATPERADGRCIGSKTGRVGTTDIALMELNDGESFENELFVSEDFPEGQRLQQLLPAQQLPRGEVLYMDSPGTNAIAGTHLYTSRCRVPADDESAEQYDWLRGSWMYFVQDENRTLPNSICGSVVCDGKGNVVAFF